MLKTKTKTKLGAKAVKQVAKNPSLLRIAPPATRITWKFAKPIAKRRARRRAQRIGETVVGIVSTVETVAPYVARAGASLAPPPKRKRVAPKVGAAVLGTGAAAGAAAAVYFQGGRGQRRKLQG
ncbi:MAG TPA: hypothetical protein VG186_10620 [Solirubrobacteraceae bacterium]|jgi:hypothetical protein|nr:hypothetical protein [Solirubrobacteraceae bacterium]